MSNTTPSSSFGVSPSTAHTSPGDVQEYQTKFLKAVGTGAIPSGSPVLIHAKPQLRFRDSDSTVTSIVNSHISGNVSDGKNMAAAADTILPTERLFQGSETQTSTIVGVHRNTHVNNVANNNFKASQAKLDQIPLPLNSGTSDTGVSDTLTIPEGSNIVFAKKAIKQQEPVKQTLTPSAFSSFSSQVGRSNSAYRHKHRMHNTINGSGPALATSCECNSPPQSPPVLSNDQSRIQTPASTLPPSMSSSLEIGAHLPFTNANVDSANEGTNNTGLQASTLKASLSQLELALPSLRHSKTQPYQPARVVLQRHLSSNEQLTNTSMSPIVTVALGYGSTTRQYGVENFPYLGMKEELFNSQSTISLPASPTKGNQGLFSTPAHTTLSHDSSDSARSARSASAFQGRPPRQLRDPRQPLYLPAVLRRTTTYDDSSNDNNATSSTNPQQRLPSHSFVFRPPPQNHWKPDSSRDSCRDCQRKFTLFERRHHCRRCGEIFCSEHSKYKVGLDEHLKFNPQGYVSRACSHCAMEYQMFLNEDEQQPVENSISSIPGSLSGDVFVQNIAAVKKLNNPKNDPALVGSVPADWSWSTF